MPHKKVALKVKIINVYVLCTLYNIHYVYNIYD